MLWFNKEEEPKVIHKNERQKCWESRDLFFACLDQNNIIDASKDSKSAKQKCPVELKEFETACIKTWVDYFKQKRVQDYTKQMRILELEKAGYKPLDAPLQVKSISKDEV